MAGGDSPVHGGGSAPAAVLQLAAREGNAETDRVEESHDLLVQLTAAEETTAPQATSDGSVPEEAGVDGINRNEQRIVTALQSRVRAQIDFIEQPLRDVAAILSEEYGFPIMIDQPALDTVGASADLAVSLQVHNVSLKSALNLMLKSNASQLSYIVDNEVLMITSAEEAAAHMEAVIYDLGQITELLGSNIEEISKIISETVARDAWEINGTGEGTMQPLSNQYLVISQSQAVHEDIAKLLARMQQKAEAAK